MTILSETPFTDLLARDAPMRDALLEESSHLPKIVLTQRQLCDLELIINGAFSPLNRFMTEADYHSCCSSLRLQDGTLWPIPITLDVDEEQIQTCGIRKGNARIVLVQADYPERPLAIIHATDFFSYDKEEEAKLVFNTTDTLHPAVAYLFEESKDWLIGGSISAINLPIYSDFLELRQTPSQVRTYFSQMGWEKIVAFQTRNPMHRAHQELTKRAAAALNAKLLIHPVVGMTKPGDIHYKVRVEAYKVIVQKYPKNLVTLALLPLAMRMGGPREALLHAIIRKNYGCTHFIVGRDHAGPGSDSQGKLFYEAYEAQGCALKYEQELGIKIVPFQMVSYCPELDEYIAEDEVPKGTKALNISGTQLRQALKSGAPIPEWFSYPEVVQILRKAYPPN